MSFYGNYIICTYFILYWCYLPWCILYKAKFWRYKLSSYCLNLCICLSLFTSFTGFVWFPANRPDALINISNWVGPYPLYTIRNRTYYYLLGPSKSSRTSPFLPPPVTASFLAVSATSPRLYAVIRCFRRVSSCNLVLPRSYHIVNIIPNIWGWPTIIPNFISITSDNLS